MKMLRAYALTASLACGLASLVAPAIAAAQPGAPTAQTAPAAPSRPQPQPAQARGTVARYIVGPMGHVRGFVLNTGAVVMMHGRAGNTLAQQVPVGRVVRVEGLAFQGSPQTIVRGTIYAQDGSVLFAPPPYGPRAPGAAGGQGGQGGPETHHGRRGMRGQRGQMMAARVAQLPARTASGTVQTVLAGPRGRTRGVLLSDGSSVFFGRELTRALQNRTVRVGEAVRVSGRGNSYGPGASLVAERIVFADGTTVDAPMTFAPPPAAPVAPTR